MKCIDLRTPWSPYSFRIEFVQLSLAIGLTPQAEYFGFRTEGHVHQLLEPASIVDFAENTSKNDAIVPHLHEQHVARVVRSPVNGETLLLQQSTTDGP
jgi:hypothetical protein